MDQLKQLSDVWPLVLAFLGTGIWFVKLGAKVDKLESSIHASNKRFESLEKKHEALDSKVVEELAFIRESLARMEGHFGLKRGGRE